MDSNGGDKSLKQAIEETETLRRVDDEGLPSQTVAIAKMIHKRLQTDVRWEEDEEGDGEMPIYVDMEAAEEVKEQAAYRKVAEEKRKKDMYLTGVGGYVMKKGDDARAVPADNKTRVYGMPVPRHLLVQGIKKMFDEFIKYFQDGEKLTIIDFLAFFEDMRQYCGERGIRISLRATKREGFTQRISGVFKRVSGVITRSAAVDGVEDKKLLKRFSLSLVDDFDKRIECMLIFDERAEELELSVVCEEPERFLD